jgi:hypothetical protein
MQITMQHTAWLLHIQESRQNTTPIRLLMSSRMCLGMTLPSYDPSLRNMIAKYYYKNYY